VIVPCERRGLWCHPFGFAKNHGFVDGNKRVAFMAAYVSLGLNGYDLDADEPEIVATWKVWRRVR
jgi:prophage maintenance system killer protein